jgi:hypothetical protein
MPETLNGVLVERALYPALEGVVVAVAAPASLILGEGAV